MLPVEEEGDEAAAVVVVVEREVFVDEVDPPAEIGEVGGPVLEHGQASHAVARRAVDEDVRRDDAVPPSEIGALEGVVDGSGDGEFRHVAVLRSLLAVAELRLTTTGGTRGARGSSGRPRPLRLRRPRRA